jgi:hypothetical protein
MICCTKFAYSYGAPSRGGKVPPCRGPLGRFPAAFPSRRPEVPRLERGVAVPGISAVGHSGHREKALSATLAIQGCEDEYGTLSQIESVANASAKLKLLEIPDCGHSAHAQYPEMVIG